MKLLAAALLLLPVLTSGQYNVTVILDSVPAQTNADYIFIAGNFNEWQPQDYESALQKNSEGKYAKQFYDVQPGVYEFKFTLGSMETIETNADGTDINNRALKVQSDTVVHLTIARWKQQPGKTAFQNTTSNIHDTIHYYPFAICRAGRKNGLDLY